MAHRHFYMGIENLNLNAAQRAILIAELRALGPPREGDDAETQPCRLNHWRTRLDGQAAIFEALFDEDALAVERFKRRLGAIFGVDPATIDHSTATAHFAGGDTPVVTFSRGGTDYLRFALFGGVGATWQESRLETLGYLAANAEEWGE